MWDDIWFMQIPVWDKALRTVAVYGGLVVLLRLAGRRDLAQFNSFDLVVVLVLANVVQNAIIGPDDSLTGGLLGAALLVGLNAVWVRVANRSQRSARIAEGRSVDLVRGGEVVADLTRLGIRRHDVVTALHRQGAHRLADVERATLSPSGSIVFEVYAQARPVTVGQWRAAHDELLAEIRALRAERG